MLVLSGKRSSKASKHPGLLIYFKDWVGMDIVWNVESGGNDAKDGIILECDDDLFR